MLHNSGNRSTKETLVTGATVDIVIKAAIMTDDVTFNNDQFTQDFETSNAYLVI